MDNNAIQLIEALSQHVEILIFGGMTICGVLAIVFGTVASVLNRISTEHSRREIAAYIAEGSMTPEQGERLMAADPNNRKRSRC